jgi:hypothetical protein
VLELRVRDAEADLAEALRRVVRSGMREARLVFRPDLRLEPASAEQLTSILRQATVLERLVLVHPGPVIRFLAAALALRLPKITFDVDDGRDPSTQPRVTATLPATAGHRVALDPRPDPADAVGAALRPLLQWNLRTLVIVLEPTITALPGRLLASALADELAAFATLQRVVLVHSDLALRAVAAIVAARCAGVRVSACADEIDARGHLLEPR